MGLPVLLANSLPAVLLALAIIFLARPLTYAPPKTKRELTNIQIVLDSSTSMVFNTYGPQDGSKPYIAFPRRDGRGGKVPDHCAKAMRSV